MAWQFNKNGGIFKQGSSTSYQKRHQILATFLSNGSKSRTAKETSSSYNLVSKIVEKFANTGLCEPGDRGRPPKKMDVWKRAYLEVLVTINPFLYLDEIRDAMQTDLNLANADVPSISVISRTLSEDLDLTRHKATEVAAERFTQLNMDQRRAFVQWRMGIDPRRIFFLDETAIQLKDEIRTIGRVHTNEALPLVTPKGDNREKMSVLVLIGYDGGVLGVYPIYGNFYRVSFNYGFSNFLLPLIPRGSFLVMDNASIHNDQDLVNFLTTINSTLVKLPTYSYDLNPVEMVNGVARNS